jgi:hypothetical protein
MKFHQNSELNIEVELNVRYYEGLELKIHMEVGITCALYYLQMGRRKHILQCKELHTKYKHMIKHSNSKIIIEGSAIIHINYFLFKNAIKHNGSIIIT